VATYQINDYYEVTVRQEGTVGPRTYRCTGDIYRKDTGVRVDRVHGEGAVRTAADRRALAAASAWAAHTGAPKDWKK